MNDEWRKSYWIIKEKHDQAYTVIEAAIKHEEEEHPELVIHIIYI